MPCKKRMVALKEQKGKARQKENRDNEIEKENDEIIADTKELV